MFYDDILIALAVTDATSLATGLTTSMTTSLATSLASVRTDITSGGLDVSKGGYLGRFVNDKKGQS